MKKNVKKATKPKTIKPPKTGTVKIHPMGGGTGDGDNDLDDGGGTPDDPTHPDK